MTTITMPQKRGAGKQPYRELGHRIAALRRERGLSQWDLAEKAGISKGYPGSLETGANRPTPETLQAIARALEADYNELADLAGFTQSAPTNDERAQLLAALEVAEEKLEQTFADIKAMLLGHRRALLSSPPAADEAQQPDAENGERDLEHK